MSQTEVSIVIVNYRVKYFLEQTIRSAQEALQGLNGEIIVIDNNSGDGSIEHIKAQFADITVIDNKENAGFGKANNQGFALAKGEYTLILNPDTIIGRDTIADCLDLIRTHSDCGGIGVDMHDGNGVFLPESKRAFPTPWVSFCKIFGLSKLFPNSRIFAKYHLRFLPESETHKVDILSGAFLFIRTDLLRSIGGFDEDFFMYGEDIDLSFRIVKAGYSNYYLPTPIIHYKGESTQKNSYRYVRVFYEAMRIFFRKHYPHFSRFYGFFIEFAIKLRAAASILTRFLMKRIPAKKSPTESRQFDTMLIVSANPEQVKKRTKIAATGTITTASLSEASIPATGRNFIIIDNRAASYQDIIRFICANSSKDNSFATYLSQAEVVIYPKMDEHA